MLEQALGHMSAGHERVLLCEPHNLEAYAHLERGDLAGQPIWYGVIDPETVTELDASAAVAQFWREHPRQ